MVIPEVLKELPIRETMMIFFLTFIFQFNYRNSGDGRFVFGRRYSSEDLTFDLPSGTDLCDVATFTIWCQAASVFFTRVDIPSSLFVS